MYGGGIDGFDRDIGDPITLPLEHEQPPPGMFLELKR
jgi:hypothetical protein